MGKGWKYFFAIDIIFLIICAFLIFMENKKEATGLPALSSVGSFVIYIIMFLAGLLVLIGALLIKSFYKK